MKVVVKFIRYRMKIVWKLWWNLLYFTCYFSFGIFTFLLSCCADCYYYLLLLFMAINILLSFILQIFYNAKFSTKVEMLGSQFYLLLYNRIVWLVWLIFHCLCCNMHTNICIFTMEFSTKVEDIRYISIVYGLTVERQAGCWFKYSGYRSSKPH